MAPPVKFRALITVTAPAWPRERRWTCDHDHRKDSAAFDCGIAKAKRDMIGTSHGDVRCAVSVAGATTITITTENF
jgi:hypothetical protein